MVVATVAVAHRSDPFHFIVLALYYTAAETNVKSQILRSAPGASGDGGLRYFSTISRISMGQLLTQMPQAMHLLAGPPETAGGTITWKGQTSAHLPQPMHLLS